jgi:hypothetical protein
MMRYLFLFAVLLSPATARAGEADARARAALALAAARPPQAPPVRATYTALRARAIDEDRALVVFVGVPSRVGAWLSHAAPTFAECNPPCVLVSVPHNGELYRADHTLPASASSAAIEEVILRLRQRLDPPAVPVRTLPPVQQQMFYRPAMQQQFAPVFRGGGRSSGC